MCLLPTRILAQGAAVAQAKKGATVMRKVKICLVVLGVLALAFISMPMRAQNQGYPFPGYPPEMSPLRTFRTPPAQASLVPATKFVKVHNAIPNKYIVVLNDDVVSSNAPVDVRRA